LVVYYQEVDMSFQYEPAFRREVCERLLAGESVERLARELSMSPGTLYRWKRQALVDVGQVLGPKSFESDPLAQARRTIKELEKELKLVKAASALFDEEEPPNPKGSSRLFED
jgi:transposase-like protein